MKLPDSGYGSVLPGGKAFKTISVPPAQWPVPPKDIKEQRALDDHFAKLKVNMAEHAAWRKDRLPL